MIQRSTRARSKTDSARRRKVLAGTSMLSAMLVAISMLMPVAAHAADTAGLTIQKSVSDASVTPGQTFNWIIEVGCSVLEEECINAQLVDTIPSEFVVGGPGTIAINPPINESGEATIDVTGQTVTVDFSVPLSLPQGQFGLANEIVTITIPVTVRSDLPYSAAPITAANTATVSADNASAKSATASTTITVPLDVATVADKAFAPTTVLGTAGSTTTVTVGGTNTSNSKVDSFIIQDPEAPASAPIFATTLRVDSLGEVTWPAGAETAVVSVWDFSISGWVDAPLVTAGSPLALPTVSPTDIRGVRIAFASATPAMQTGETASFELNTVVRAGAGSGNRSNTSTSVVSVHGETATAPATQSLTLQAATTSVGATKTIAPDRLSAVAYEPEDFTEATVTLTARNTGSVALSSLTISEPSTPGSLAATNPLAPAHPGGGLTFQAFDSVMWPTGATAASITYYYSDSMSSVGDTTVVGAMPAPEPGKRVTGFAVTFTGASLPPDSVATLPFTVKTNPAQTESRVDVLNQIGVSGTPIVGGTVTATAQDDAIIYGERLELSTQKSLTRDELVATPGQLTTATLRTAVSPYPQSSHPAKQIIQYDPPQSESGLNEWYRYFNPTALAVTSVPGGATLTVQYRNSEGVWADIGPSLTGLDDSGSPYNIDIPATVADQAYGIRMVWNSPTGFVPGSTIESNLNFQLRSTLRDSGTPLPNADLDNTLYNCSSADGWMGNSVDPDATAISAAPCPFVNLRSFDPETGPGTGDIPLYKQFRTVSNNTVSNTEKNLTSTRSRERTGVRLSWSTGGRTGISSMTITDAAVTAGSPTPAGHTKGMYDAFNLVRINGINAIDSYLQHDRVAIEAFNVDTGVWETPAGISCTVEAPCMTFGGYTLTATQQELYVGVRFIYTERPGRTGIEQPAGAGVAVSTGNSRGITLIYAIRDTLRSDANFPVVNGPHYNSALSESNSVVRNDAHAAAVTSTGTITRAVADTIELQDEGLHLSVRKTWTGGPLPITGDPQPTSRVTLRTTNQTPQPSTVSELTILEPNPDTIATENPFEHFNLSRIHSYTHPAGATSVLIEARNGLGTVLESASGSGSTTNMNAAFTTAQSWSATQLENVESLRVHYTGRMGLNAYAQVQFDLTVRETMRTGGSPVVPGTVDNGTKGSVSDLRFDPASDPADPDFFRSELASNARASIEIVESTIGVGAGKSFNPASQAEGVAEPITMTLTGTPSGSERVRQLVLTDERATFWNAFDFVAKGTITLPTFTSQGGTAGLLVEVCTGAIFEASTVESTPTAGCEALGGTWQTNGTLLTQTQLDASAFLPAGVAAGDVTGVRLTVKRSDEAQWENPHAPTITIPLTVQRRDNLRTGGAVPSEYAGNSAAPGETVVGQTTNTVRADITGIWGGTAHHSTDATYRFVHLTTGVQVSKLPTGVRAPGVQIPYELTILNTGQLPIENPVITDDFPTDATGAMLIFNPDAPTNYTFTVTGGSVPDGAAPIPSGTFTGTTPGVVTITPTTDAIGPTQLAFTFPAGTVIGVGQTVKVRIPVFFRPGLSHDTQLNNVFEVKGDRLLDACTAPSGSAAPANTTSAGYGCETSALITIAQAPALRALISVKALETPGVNFPGGEDPNSQFVGGTNEDCRAAQDAAGFSRPQCAPQTIPGQESTWRLTVQNTGTTEISRLVVATRLPTVGDETIVSNLVRNSAWTAQFNGQIADQFGAGTTVQVFYTTMDQPCVGVLDQPSNASACGTDPATGWALLPIGDGDFDPSIVTGLQFVVDYPDDAPFLPGVIATVDIGTTTVADLSVFSGGLVSDPLAINSLSVSGISPTAPIPRISALDYSRSLLSLATGTVTLTKDITGPASDAIPDGTEFVGSLVCTLLGESFTRPFQFTVTGGVITPSVITLENLPGGASCTVTETPASGQSTYTATTVIVDPLADPAALPNIELVNDYQFTQFEVSKTVTASLGTLVPTNFEFEASCLFLGQPVDLDPLTPGNDLVFELDHAGTRVITGVPVNSECIVIETNNRGADVTVVSGGTEAPGTVTEEQAGLSVTITGLRPQVDPNGSNVNWMNFNNRYDSGAVVFIEKDFAGGAADQFGENALPEKSFMIHAVCTFENVTQFEGDLVLNSANGWSEGIENLTEGAECYFTEPDLNGADLVVFSPSVTVPTADPSMGLLIVPGINDTATVTATNWFLTGAIEVTKTWEGDGAEKFGQLPDLDYEFTLLCTREGVEVDLTDTGGSTRIVNVTSPTASYTGIASGADCVLTETESNGAYSWRVLDNAGDELTGGVFTITVDPDLREQGNPVDDQPQSFAPLAVENTFLFAEVSVAKTVDVQRPNGASSGPFEVLLECTLDGRPIDAAESAIQPISDGETVTWTELAAGADCVVTETVTGGSTATGHRIMGASGELSARVEGAATAMPSLQPNLATGTAINHVEFINSYPLPSTGSIMDGQSILVVALGGGVLVLWGSLVLLSTSRRPTSKPTGSRRAVVQN